MKKIKIVATIGKVYAPKKINVFINNLDNDLYDKYYESQKSFDQDFEATNGRYIINVIGMNQDDDITTVTIKGDFVLADTKSSDQENYVMVFIGNVN